MSDVSDSQNRFEEDEPYISGGDPSDVESSKSKMVPDPVLMPEPMNIVHLLGWTEGMDESSSQLAGGLSHTPGSAQCDVEETGLVERANTSGVGNYALLFDEEEEGEAEEDQEGESGKEEEGEDGESEQQDVVAEEAEPKGRKKKKGTPPVLDTIKATVDGYVSTTRSIMTASKLEALRIKYDISTSCVMREPTSSEVACSHPDSPDEVCLYEHMFSLGMRIVDGEWLRGFSYLIYIINHYRLSPGQFSTNGFAIILGFWDFIYECHGKEITITPAPFPYFNELRERRKEGRYHFARRPYHKIPVLQEVMDCLKG